MAVEGEDWYQQTEAVPECAFWNVIVSYYQGYYMLHCQILPENAKLNMLKTFAEVRLVFNQECCKNAYRAKAAKCFWGVCNENTWLNLWNSESESKAMGVIGWRIEHLMMFCQFWLGRGNHFRCSGAIYCQCAALVFILQSSPKSPITYIYQCEKVFL
jgi:hypothetical protein